MLLVPPPLEKSFTYLLHTAVVSYLSLYLFTVLIIDAKRDTDSAEFKNKMTGLLTRLFVAANAKKGQSSSDVCVQVSAV